MPNITLEKASPHVGAIARVDKRFLCDKEVVQTVKTALEEFGVIVFPQIDVDDAEQLAFTDMIGERVNFTGKVPGSDQSSEDVYTITLDNEINIEPDYVLGSFFWHMDGMTLDQPLPKATTLSARTLSRTGGSTEFASLYAAYDALPESEKREYEDLCVVHSLEASMRPVHGVTSAERIQRYNSIATPMEHPLVWTHDDGRKSLLIGTHADGVVGMPGPHGRALIARLIQWAGQPAFVYRHEWTVGDLVIWNNEGLMHRVVPYTDGRRQMHRTTIMGANKPGGPVSAQALEDLRRLN